MGEIRAGIGGARAEGSSDGFLECLPNWMPRSFAFRSPAENGLVLLLGRVFVLGLVMGFAEGKGAEIGAAACKTSLVLASATASLLNDPLKRCIVVGTGGLCPNAIEVFIGLDGLAGLLSDFFLLLISISSFTCLRMVFWALSAVGICCANGTSSSVSDSCFARRGMERDFAGDLDDVCGTWSSSCP